MKRTLIGVLIGIILGIVISIGSLYLLLLYSLKDVSFLGPGSGDGVVVPAETYERMVMSPVPASIHDLEVDRHIKAKMQGFVCRLRFQASDADIDAIIATGFETCDWESMEQWPNELDESGSFNPAWDPDAIVEAEYYCAGVRNDWAYVKTHYMVIDRSTGVVYFVAIGG